MHKIRIFCSVFVLFLFAQMIVGASHRFYVKQAQLSKYEQNYGPRAVKRLNALLSLMDARQNDPDEEKLAAVNRFFNQIPYRTDRKNWGKSDYWASRLEFLGKGMGDCEDYAVAKYLTLTQLGVPQERLFMTYVRAKGFSEAAHMVVSYYTDRKAVPLILDNYDKRILPATQRKDLIPVYSFTGQDLFLQKQKGLGKRVDPSKVKNLQKLRSIDLEIYRG
ncbi:MAG: transglutaminase-like cysteine peptidase [Desulfobacter sp.]|nr:transglutaminase-like cysteine peptidase [Desulfobacter sp.]